MRIYTKQGDGGKTSLFDGTRVEKCDLRLETYGTLDELNSHLGLALAYCQNAALTEMLKKIQHELFDAGSDLATPLDSPNGTKIRRIEAADYHRLEKWIDEITEKLPPLKNFVLPGGTQLSAQLHVCRTVCRRAERNLVALQQRTDVGPFILIYLNRLSDFLFTCARWANVLSEVNEVFWSKQF
jgi:cob(I)alamin adenosyltransferase